MQEKMQLIGRGVMKFLLKTISVISMFFLFSCSENKQASLAALLKDKEAAALFKLKQYDQSAQAYYKILETDPDLMEAHSNIAVIFLNQKKNEEALKSFQKALKIAESNKNEKLQFISHFNLGVYYGALQKIPEALEHYQKALDLVPTSIETKHNIELLIQDDEKNQSNKNKQNKDQKDDKDQKDSENKDNNKDKQDQQDKKENKDQQNKQDQKDKKDQDSKQDDQKEADKKPQQFKDSAKYKPRPFKGDQLSEGDVKKILGELTNQEQKIRAHFEKKERKEKKNEKDW